MKSIKLGSKGEDVKVLQKILNLEVDGKFGIRTDKAVREFQIKNNLIADGIVGNNTWKALGITDNGICYNIFSEIYYQVSPRN